MYSVTGGGGKFQLLLNVNKTNFNNLLFLSPFDDVFFTILN